jgi:hypothetical protein
MTGYATGFGYFGQAMAESNQYKSAHPRASAKSQSRSSIPEIVSESSLGKRGTSIFSGAPKRN